MDNQLNPNEPVLLRKDLDNLGVESVAELKTILERNIKAGSDVEKQLRIQEDLIEATKALTENSKALLEERKLQAESDKFDELDSSNFKKAFESASETDKQKIWDEISEKFGADKATLALSNSTVEKFVGRPIAPTHKNFEEISNIQKANDSILLLTAALGGSKPTRLSDQEGVVLDSATYRKAVAMLRGGDMESKGFGDALDSLTSTEGLEWVPTLYSATLQRDVFLALQVAGTFRRIPMPSATYKMPYQSGRTRAYKMSQATNVSPFTQLAVTSSQDTSDLTMTAVKLGFAQFVSGELREDSIINVIQEMYNETVWGMASAIDDAVLNGSLSLTDLDNTGTDGGGTPANNNRLWSNTSDSTDGIRLGTGAADARNAWDGIRKLTNSGARVDAGNVAPNLANFRSLRKKMDKYGADASKLVAFINCVSQIDFMNIPEVLTIEKYGPQATVLVGEIGKLDSIALIQSEYQRNDYNANGRFDNSTKDRTIVSLVHRDGFVLGDRRAMTVQSGDNALADQSFIVTTQRLAFMKAFLSAANVASELYNLSK